MQSFLKQTHTHTQQPLMLDCDDLKSNHSAVRLCLRNGPFSHDSILGRSCNRIMYIKRVSKNTRRAYFGRKLASQTCRTNLTYTTRSLEIAVPPSNAIKKSHTNILLLANRRVFGKQAFKFKSLASLRNAFRNRILTRQEIEKNDSSARDLSCST